MRVLALEALARWDHPSAGCSPSEFIPFAEESGLIVALGRHLRAQACSHSWQTPLPSPPRLAPNVSAREVQRSDSAARSPAPPSQGRPCAPCLEIEFTETAVFANPTRAAEAAACLREAGASVALDDFGTGYSSLTHLRELPIDRVKVDRSFVASCLEDRSAAAILVGVTRLAHDLDIEVVAEGIETEEQLQFVRQIGCDAAQGFLARPMAVEDCTQYLRRQRGGAVAGHRAAARTAAFSERLECGSADPRQPVFSSRVRKPISEVRRESDDRRGTSMAQERIEQGVGVFVFDPSYRLRDCDRHLSALVGLTREELLGLDLQALQRADLLALSCALKGEEGTFRGFVSWSPEDPPLHVSERVSRFATPRAASRGASS